MDGWRRYYPPDVFGPLWDRLSELISAGEIRSPDEVLWELEKKDDEVCKWAKLQADLFVPLEEEVQSVTSVILAEFPRLVDTRRNRGQADPFVIAHALLVGATVVTGERGPGTANRPTIPFVCKHYSVPFMDLLGLMREQGWRFS